ncbi:hypothetical protein ASG78_00680 [Nostocoides sp. Soil756]|nr:hypothetical protein ASG78_00680 [Tetrasphaera sp. Soil756]
MRAGPQLQRAHHHDEAGQHPPDPAHGGPSASLVIAPGQPARGGQGHQADAVGDLGGGGEAEEGTGQGGAGRAGGAGGHRDGHHHEGRRHDVDVGPEHAQAEDERVEGPDDVDPAVMLRGKGGPQRPSGGQPREHHDELPDPDLLAQRRPPDPRRQPVQQGGGRPVDARFLGPGGLDAAGDGVGAAGPRDRRLHPRVAPADQDAAVRDVADVVGGTEGGVEQGDHGQQPGHPPAAQGARGAAQAQQHRGRAQEVGAPEDAGDDGRVESER